jgi:hypothetical protein
MLYKSYTHSFTLYFKYFFFLNHSVALCYTLQIKRILNERPKFVKRTLMSEIFLLSKTHFIHFEYKIN